MARDPLDTLTEVREQKVDEATSALARALAAKEAASLARRRAEAERDGHASRVARALEGERAALDRGALRAGDLAIDAAWRRRVVEEREALTAGVGRARDLEADAVRSEQGARAGLAARKTDADVVATLRSRREAERRKKVDARAEEAAAEARRPRR